MTNREKLAILIAELVSASRQDGYDSGRDQKAYPPSPATDTADKKLVEFINSLNLDPVLETWEQAAKREGWTLDTMKPKVEGLTRFRRGNSVSSVWDVDYPDDKWNGLCVKHGIERQTIDAGKTT